MPNLLTAGLYHMPFRTVCPTLGCWFMIGLPGSLGKGSLPYLYQNLPHPQDDPLYAYERIRPVSISF